jgi:hypothetical protein
LLLDEWASGMNSLREEVGTIPHTVLDTEMRRHRVRFIKKVLVRNKWHMTKTAKDLKMRRSQLYHIITHDQQLTKIWRSGRVKALQRQHRKVWRESKRGSMRSPRSTSKRS